MELDVKTKRLKLHSMLPFMPWERMTDELIDLVFDYENNLEPEDEQARYLVGEIRSAIAHYTMCLSSIQDVRDQLGLRSDISKVSKTLDRKDTLKNLKALIHTINNDKHSFLVFSWFEDGIDKAKTHILASFRQRLEKAYTQWIEGNRSEALKELLEKEGVRNLPGLGWRSV